MRLLIDADACPVKEETYKVAFRYNIDVKLVSNTALRIPRHPLLEMIIVSDGFDAADDWIATTACDQDIVVTSDIPLADRCLKAGATTMKPNGTLFTLDSIGDTLATRNLMQDLRGGGDQLGGPPPFSKKDRSQFLQSLDQEVVRLRNNAR